MARARERRDPTFCLYCDARPEVAPRQYHGIYQRARNGLKPLGEWFARGIVASDGVVTEAKQALTTDMPEAIGFIRSSTAKMDRLVNAILKISREGALHAAAGADRPRRCC